MTGAWRPLAESQEIALFYRIFPPGTPCTIICKPMDDPDAPDGAWWAKLENVVTFFNQEKGTNHYEFEMVQVYINYEPKNQDLTGK